MSKNHFTATGIVFGNNGKILMIKHKKLNVWLPPGGHVEENELPDKAVLREIFEETGITARIVSTGKKLDFSEASGCKQLETPFLVLLEDIEGGWTHNHIDLIYLCFAENNGLLPQQSEIDDIGWFSYDEIIKLPTYENVIRSVSAAISCFAEKEVLK